MDNITNKDLADRIEQLELHVQKLRETNRVENNVAWASLGIYAIMLAVLFAIN